MDSKPYLSVPIQMFHEHFVLMPLWLDLYQMPNQELCLPQGFDALYCFLQRSGQ